MKLYQALKAKKKMAAELSQLWQKLHGSNSILKGSERNYDPRTTWDEINKKSDELIVLKVSIQTANKPILERIYRIAELKSKASSLKSLNTRNGLESSRSHYGTDVVPCEYESIIKQTEVDILISGIEAEITKLQDEIEQYNFTTEL